VTGTVPDRHVALITGEVVPTNSAEWLAEKRIRYQHVMRLARINTTQGRRDYIAGIERTDGKLAGDRLKDAYLAHRDDKRAAGR